MSQRADHALNAHPKRESATMIALRRLAERLPGSGPLWLGIVGLSLAYWFALVQSDLLRGHAQPDGWLALLGLGGVLLIAVLHALQLRTPRTLLSWLLVQSAAVMSVRLALALFSNPAENVLTDSTTVMLWALILPVLAATTRVSPLAARVTSILPLFFVGLLLAYAATPQSRSMSTAGWLQLGQLSMVGFGMLLAGRNFAGLQRKVERYQRRNRRLRRLAFFDDLTRLHNRAYLEQHFRELFVPGTQAAVLFLDLDGFKSINDTLGHATGDEVLKLVSARVEACARQASCLARVSGDEFVVVFPYVHRGEVNALARQLIQQLSDPFILREHLLRLSVSVGISLYPQDGEDGNDLLRRADVAMYNVKRSGKNGLRFYGGELHGEDEHRQLLERELRNAEQRGELRLVFQPICSLPEGRPLCFETLLRWQHAELGNVSPEQFIPIAETCGLIGPIGRWVLAGALSMLRRWRDAGLTELRVAVNVSPLQLMQPGFAELVRTELERHGLPPSALELEVTEGVELRDKDQIMKTLDQLRTLGIVLSLDDFGMGFASLSHLNDLPVQVVKIDKTFVSDLIPDAAETDHTRALYVRSLISAMVTVAATLDLEIVAEGVETEQQARELTRLGCHSGQGYYFQKPISGGEVLGLLLPSHAG